MKCAIPTIDDVDLATANSAALGVETVVLVSNVDVRHLGDVTQSASGAGLLTRDLVYRPPTALATGRDIQFVCLNSVKSDANIVATLNVLLGGGLPWVEANAVLAGAYCAPTVPNGHLYKCTTAGTTGATDEPTWPTADGGTVTDGTAVWTEANALPATAVATLKAPALARDQSNALPQGLAVDFVTPAGTTVRTVTSLASITGGGAGNRFAIVAMPEEESYVSIAECTDKELEAPVGKAVPIPQGYNAAQWVKKGRSDIPKLTIKAKYISAGDGLARINGQRITAMLVTRKDDSVLTERVIVGGYRPVVKIKSPDGNSEAEATAEGIFEKFAVFV